MARPALTHETDDQCVPHALAFLYPIVVYIIALFMALVALYYDIITHTLCWKTSPQRYHVMRLVGETSWQESDQSENFDRAVEVP